MEESLGRARTQTVASVYLANAASRMLVAEVDGRIAATISCSASGRRCVIHGLYVRPKFQRRGIGSRLLRALLESLRECDEVSLKALTVHPHVIAFYRRYGFVVVRPVAQPLDGTTQDMVEMRLACPRERIVATGT